jgi:CheY-like chemotaxis protein
VAPVLGDNPPAAEPPAAEPVAGDVGRRGKPKRRRFNFNVLESLEKMVQSRTAEPLPPTGWTPPASATPPAPPPAATPTPLAAPAALEPTAEAEPVPPAEVSVPSEEPRTEADFKPLRFGPENQTRPDAKTESLPLRFGPEVEAEPEEPAAVEKEPEPELIVAEAPVAVPQPEPEPEPAREARRSMRSMLFGEEAVSITDKPEPAAEPAASEPEPVAAEHPWGESASVPEPITEAPESENVYPWNVRPSWEPEPEPEVVATSAKAEEPAVPETPAADGGGGPSAGTVVIIEDDPSAATYYATLFRGNGYRVEVANDGVSGVDLCTRLQPQLIMLDVMMPRQNGILVLQTLRASDETKNTPVVVMSNFSEPTLIKRAIQLGALEYVIKTQVEGPALLNALPRWMSHEKAFAAA